MTQPTEAQSVFVDKQNLPRIGPQQSAITAAEVAHSMTGVDSVNIGVLDNAMDALGTKINLIISALEINGDLADN